MSIQPITSSSVFITHATWTGPTNIYETDVKVIELLSRDILQAVAKLPSTIVSNEFQAIYLTQPESNEPVTLQLEIQEIDKIVLKLGPLSTQIRVPRAIVVGEDYNILITSTDQHVRAALMRNTPYQKISIDEDKNLLTSFVTELLRPSLDNQIDQFIKSYSNRVDWKLKTTYSNGDDFILSEIEALQPDFLHPLMTQLRILDEQCAMIDASPSQDALVKSIFGLCLQALTATRLENIIRSTLEGMIEGNIPEQVRAKINTIAEQTTETIFKAGI